MSKQQIINNFDPNQPGHSDGTLFGLPFSAEQSEIIVVPVPWEVTVSYGAGTSMGDKAVFEASFQVDLNHQEFPELWKLGIFLDDETPFWRQQSKLLKKLAQSIIRAQEEGKDVFEDQNLKNDLFKINHDCRILKEEVKDRMLYWMNQGKMPGLLGGDHSTPLGFFEAQAEKHDEFGILHLDAHLDLRKSYEEFSYSHASIMYNAIQIPQVKKLVQVGIRDFCEQEIEVVKESVGRIKVFSDLDLKKALFEGSDWKRQCEMILNELPQKVHISFDIDVLCQWYCPNTGTPVPGGLSFEQASYLLTALSESGREIIGFDLVEVAPGENDDWDGNVGARLLFHLCGVMAKSAGKNVGDRIEF